MSISVLGAVLGVVYRGVPAGNVTITYHNSQYRYLGIVSALANVWNNI